MDETIHIIVLAGTTREQRQSIAAAKYVAAYGATLPHVTIQLVDPKDFTFNGDGNDPESKDPRYTDITAKADAFFIVTPEYNHSFPGSLKRMLDSELANYAHKPVALAGASSGGWGGVRAVEALVGPVRKLGLVVTYNSVYFPKVQEAFDANGQPTNDRTAAGVEAAYKELIWMARTLKYGRLNIQ
jgi:NAD(P)H-dependent FMN reductase